MIDNYQSLPLGTYMKVNAVLDSQADDIDKQVQIIAILGGLSVDEVLLLPLHDYTAMAAQTAFLREHCKPTEIAEGWSFGNLRPVLDFRKLNTAQYVDFQHYSKDFPRTLPQLLSVMLIPEGKSYNDGYDVLEVQKQVEQIPFPDALGLSAFFFGRLLTLTEDSLTSWASEMRKTKDPKRMKEIAEKIREVETVLRSAGVGLPM